MLSEEAVAGVDSGDCPKVGTAHEDDGVGPGQVAGGFKAVKFRAAVEHLKEVIFRQDLLEDVFVFFLFQRTSGVDEASAGSNLSQGGTQDCDLALLQFFEIVERESPFNFGIAGESAGAGAGDVDEDSIEWSGYRKVLRVGIHDLDSGFVRM